MERLELEQRIQTLTEAKTKAEKNVIQAQADINGFIGAIADCNYWISVLDDKERKEEIKKNSEPNLIKT